jgi:hypothetical protein
VDIALTKPHSGLDQLMRIGATLAFVATLAMIGSSLVLWGGLGFPGLPVSFVRGPLGVIEIAVIALVFSSIGAFLVGRVPGFLVGWSLIIIGIGTGLHLPVGLLVDQAIRTFHPVSQPLLLSAWALTSTLVPMAAMLIAMLVMILPDGRLRSRRWRLVVVTAVAGFVLLTLGTALDPRGLVWFPTLPNPLAVPPSAGPVATVTRVVGVGLLGLALGLAAMCLVGRYRGGNDELRRQLRWVLFGGVLWAVSLTALLFSRYLIGPSDADGTLLVHIAAIGTLAVPITILIATVRHHLFGADVILTRTLVYLPLLAICSGIYAAGVALSQRLFVALTGNTSDVAIILATLLAAGAIMPVRRWLEMLVDRAMTAAQASRASHPGDAETERQELTAQADQLAGRLAEIETRLASITVPRTRDDTMDVGEPGVGRYGWRGRPDPDPREPISRPP